MKSEKYQKLPTSFTQGSQGFEYVQIDRTGNIAWYESRYQGGKDIVGFVVAKITKEKARTLPSGRKLPNREVFPRESKFGKTGWFYMPKSRDMAEAHYEELANA